MDSTAAFAAAIRYSRIEPPPEAPPDLRSSEGREVSFFAIEALDGNLVDAALCQPATRVPAETTIVLSVHGSGGNYTTSVPGILLRNLWRDGYAALTINTRQHDGKGYTENFFDARRDIEAAVATARALGYRRIVLHGQSLGNIQVQYYAATTWERDIAGVVLTGMFANLPWKSRHMLLRDEATYRRLLTQATAMLHAGEADGLLSEPVAMGQVAPPARMAARHFLSYRSEGISAADGLYWIRRVPYPVLMIRDEGDATVQPFEPNMLLAAACAADSLVPRADFVSLPNARGVNPRGHVFADTGDELVKVVVAWLDRL
jgi:pimeloyl-ACP methyl ester carboxylesterase